MAKRKYARYEKLRWNAEVCNYRNCQCHTYILYSVKKQVFDWIAADMLESVIDAMTDIFVTPDCDLRDADCFGVVQGARGHEERRALATLHGGHW